VGVVVVVVAQQVFYVSPDLRMSELRKSGSVYIVQALYVLHLSDITLIFAPLPVCNS
jgi:hypothetical protein